MTDIDLHAEVAVLCRNRDLCPDTVRPLFERQIGFQYIPESYFPACTVEDGALCLHGHRYTAVLGDKALFPGRCACGGFGARAGLPLRPAAAHAALRLL